MGERAEVAQLYELYTKILDRQIVWREDMDKLCAAFYRDKRAGGSRSRDHSRLYQHTLPAVRRFQALDDPQQREEYRGQLRAFRNLYAFLSQIIPFSDSDLEKLYTYLRFLLRQLPPPPEGPQYDFDDEVTLKYYKLQKISEGAILLDPEGEYPLEGPTEVGTAQQLSPEIELSKLIDQLNERFGTQFTAADQLFFDQIQESAAEQPELRQAALANPIENFRFIFDKALDGLFIDRMEQNDEITAKYLGDDQFHQAVTDYLREQVYARFQAEAAEDSKA